MKRRQAEKIMRQQAENDLPLHKVNLTWLRAWDNYTAATMPADVPGKRDHRIEKALKITTKAK